MQVLNRLLYPFLKYYIHRLADKSLPAYNGELNSGKLKDKVEILTDKWGVPHIYANFLSDAVFAQGFVHGRERLFQMEMGRRIARGRTAELLGPEMLNTDRIIRTLGLEKIAKSDLERYNQNPELNILLVSYSAGVNEAISAFGKNLPFEYKLLKEKPEPWTALDTISIGRLIAVQMSYGWIIEIEKMKISDLVGPEKAAELDIHYLDENPACLPRGIETFTFKDDGKLASFKGPWLKPIGGSNNWAVAPSKTADGAVHVCNDPHLPMSLPAIWYENHIVCPELEVSGITVPGTPLVLIGHNKDIAWGATLAFTDVQDTFIETFTDQSLKKYLFKGQEEKAVHRLETIKIKGQIAPHIETVIETHHGPIISAVIDYPEKQISLQSTALQDSDQFLGFFMLNKASNWDEFVKAMGHIQSPPLNVVYGDKKGNIGYWVTGNVPIRACSKSGLMPASGSSGECEWQGFVPWLEMPHALNPECGYLGTCNNKINGDKYPYDLGNLWMNGYRKKRLDSLMDSHDKIDYDIHSKMQRDVLCYPGLEFAKLYKGIESKDEKVQMAIQLLSNWDGILSAESSGGCIYQVVKREMLDLVIGIPLGEQLKNRFKGASANEFAIPLSEYFGHDTTTLLRLLKNEKSWWTQSAGGSDKILLLSIEKATEWLQAQLGNDQNDWEWGKLHQIEFNHPFGRREPLDRFLNLKPVPAPGDTDTLCQLAFFPDKGFAGTIIGAGYRQIINLNKMDESLSVLVPGQSMNPRNSHYSDQVELWKAGKYKPMLWSREKIKQHLKGTFILT